MTILSALNCASLIPNSYRRPVKPVPLLADGAVVGEALDALDGQTAKLDQANGRTADVIDIADTCNARQAQVLETLKPQAWWRFWR